MGKELRRIGAPFRQPEWSSLALLEAPDMVVQAHVNFIDAGAQVIITNNYAVVPYHHAGAFFAEQGAALTDLAGRLARQAADISGRGVAVAGSLPPLFGSYEPANFDADLARPIYGDIVHALAPHVDMWIGETLSTIAEMRTITETLATAGSKLPVWMSFSLPDTWDPKHGIALRSGESIEEIVAAVAALPLSIDAVLFNCSLPEQTGPGLQQLRTHLDAAGLAHVRSGGYANAFPTTRTGTYRANEVIFERREELTGERYAEFVAAWVDAGATIVGGCCDMYPEHIAALAERFA